MTSMRADREAADAAVFGRHQRGTIAARQQPAAGDETGQLEQRQQQRIGVVNRFQPERAAETEQRRRRHGDQIFTGRGACRRKMPSVTISAPSGTSAAGISDRRSSQTLPFHHAAPRMRNSDAIDAEQEQQAPGQRAAGIAPMQRDHGDAEADGAAEIDDGIGDHSRRHRLPPIAFAAAAAECRRPGVVQPVQDRQHQPLQRQHG